MALLLSSTTTFSPPSPSSSVSSSSTTAISPVFRFCLKPIDLQLKSINGVGIHMPFTPAKRAIIIVRASSEIEGTGSDGGEASSENKEKVVAVDKLPLESKLQEKQEQKLRMKMAKKIRLRRKRLLRKRRLRKKGRWPPSKMNKLKNV